jgi:hypothetical protein
MPYSVRSQKMAFSTKILSRKVHGGTEQRETSDRIFSVLARIKTQHPPDRSLDIYRCVNLLDDVRTDAMVC